MLRLERVQDQLRAAELLSQPTGHLGAVQTEMKRTEADIRKLAQLLLRLSDGGAPRPVQSGFSHFCRNLSHN